MENMFRSLIPTQASASLFEMVLFELLQARHIQLSHSEGMKVKLIISKYIKFGYSLSACTNTVG